VKFTVRNLRTPVVVGGGTTFNVDSGQRTADESDGTIQLLASPLETGRTSSVASYVPDPSAAQMRAAPAGYPVHLLEYTSFDLPREGDSGLRDASAADRAPP